MKEKEKDLLYTKWIHTIITMKLIEEQKEEVEVEEEEEDIEEEIDVLFIAMINFFKEVKRLPPSSQKEVMTEERFMKFYDTIDHGMLIIRRREFRR